MQTIPQENPQNQDSFTYMPFRDPGTTVGQEGQDVGKGHVH